MQSIEKKSMWEVFSSICPYGMEITFTTLDDLP